MFHCPPEHRTALEEVKRAVGVQHCYLDGWFFLFLSNKKFDVAETVAKLRRRDEMERHFFAHYVMTDSLRKSMRAGIVQYIGRDKEGHPVLYFNTARDYPKVEQRPERQANLDMFLSWAVRCDRQNPRAMVTWLINQKDASMLRNTDLLFQKDIALRISKFYPGVVSRLYLCNMSSALTFVMKPLLRQLPSVISECIFIFSASDIQKGELLQRIDADVLPLEMGGCNDCDHPPNYEWFATTVEKYFDKCIEALQAGISIKEMEMMEAFGVDKNGAPVTPASVVEAFPTAVSAGAAATVEGIVHSTMALETPRRRTTVDAGMAASASAEPLDLATMRDPCAVTVNSEALNVMVESTARSYGPDDTVGSTAACTAAVTPADWNASFASPTSVLPSLVHRESSADFYDCISDAGTVTEDHLVDAAVTREGLYNLQLPGVEEFSFSSLMRQLHAQGRPGAAAAQQDVCLRDWISFRCQCVELAPKLAGLLEALRMGVVWPSHDEEDLIRLLRRCSHAMLNLFPQTHHTLPFPLLDWYAMGASSRRNVGAAASPEGDADASSAAALDLFAVNPRRLAFRLDCTSPDNLLLCAQAGAIEFVENWDDLIAVDQQKARVLRRLLLTWPPNTERAVFVAQLKARARQRWARLVPLFHTYIEAKVGMSIADFIRHYGLLVAGGRIDEKAEWYQKLFAAVLQYRELHRRNWLFYVFPPAALTTTDVAEPPTMEELLRARGDVFTDTDAATSLMILIGHSLRHTAEQFAGEGASRVAVTRAVVERYLDVSKAKVYLPFDQQQTGLLPSESIEYHRKAAATCLHDAEEPLKEFLLATTGLAVLEHEYPTSLAEVEVQRGLLMAKVHKMQSVVERREQQRVAMCFARVCSELQGSFGTDEKNLLRTYPAAGVQADGYALGLELALAVAILQSHRCGNRVDGEGLHEAASPTVAAQRSPQPNSPSENDLSLTDSSRALGVAAWEHCGVDVNSLRATLDAMNLPASRLASLKRRYIF